MTAAGSNGGRRWQQWPLPTEAPYRQVPRPRWLPATPVVGAETAYLNSSSGHPSKVQSAPPEIRAGAELAGDGRDPVGMVGVNEMCDRGQKDYRVAAELRRNRSYGGTSVGRARRRSR